MCKSSVVMDQEEFGSGKSLASSGGERESVFSNSASVVSDVMESETNNGILNELLVESTFVKRELTELSKRFFFQSRWSLARYRLDSTYRFI